MYRATFDEQNRFKWGKTKSPKSSHFMARLPESIWFSHHEWFKSLKIAKLPPLLVTAVDTLTTSWVTNIHISGENLSFTSNLIDYKIGIFHRDELLVSLFVLSMDTLSFTLNRLKGYSIGKGNSREINITHLFSSMI